jgi:hypothetical protein
LLVGNVAQKSRQPAICSGKRHSGQPSVFDHHDAIIALFSVVNRYVGNLPPMPGVFPDYPAR